MPRIACAVVALFVVLTAPASAQLRAIGERARGGPVLLGDRVLWAEGGAGVATVFAMPAAGGPVTTFGSVPAAADDAVDLQAGTRSVAALVRDPRSLAPHGRLFWAGADGAFTALATDVGDEPVVPFVPGLQVTDAGVVTLEGSVGAFLRTGGGAAQEVALPPGADPEIVATGGTLGVAPTTDGALVVFDLRTDTEVRQISLGRFDAATVNGIAISPSGDVALTVPVGDGSDALLWAPAGASRVRVVRRGQDYATVVTAGGRIAWVAAEGARDGTRVSVIDATTRRIVFRGPLAFGVRQLSYDGRTVAFATSQCSFVGPASPTASRRTLPAGPCLRSDIAVNPESPTTRGDRYRVRVACINAPAAGCRVTARVRTRDGKSAGRLSARPPRGGARVLEIPLNARGRAEARRGRGDRLGLEVVLSDPDGRSRAVYP
jgi:hypothetical protein